MSGYRLTPHARTGFRCILDYVATASGPDVAGRVLRELEAAFEMLAERPGVGHAREDLTQDDRVRFWSVGPSLIAYRRAADGIDILVVERSERDWQLLLDAEAQAKARSGRVGSAAQRSARTLRLRESEGAWLASASGVTDSGAGGPTSRHSHESRPADRAAVRKERSLLTGASVARATGVNVSNDTRRA